jgi:WD40 repeat protein
MSAFKHCANCGSGLSGDSPEGLCPKCLLAAGAALLNQLGSAAPFEDATHLTTPASPLTGTKLRYFGDYELLEEIARGGMGIVFKARQVNLNRTVALKLINSGALASADLIKRFKAEAEAAAALNHPNIVPIYEIGEVQGQHYFSMALIDGPNLHEYQHLHPFEPREAAELIATIARAVHHAHQRGVLHRDIKPGNLLIDENGTPHLTDFGVAKLIHAETNLTHTQAILGTPAYMAPEQAAGDTKNVTTAVDIYGLGAVFYQLLAGVPPFAGNTAVEIIRHVLETDPRAPSIHNPGVDRDLETVCLKCLEKTPQRRYASADSFANDLERWVRGEPIQARACGVGKRTIKWAKRRPATAALVGVSGLAIIFLLVGLFVSNRLIVRQQEKTQRANAQLIEERNATQQALQSESKALADLTKAHEDLQATVQREQKLVYIRDIALVYREFLANNLPRANQILEQCNPELRGWEWRYLTRLCKHPGSLTFPGHLGSGSTVAYTSEGIPVSWYFAGGKIKLLNAITGEQLFQVPLKSRSSGYSFKLSATSLAYFHNPTPTQSSESELFISDLKDGHEIYHLTLPPRHQIEAVAFTPDGRKIAAAISLFERESSSNETSNWTTTGGEVRSWDLATGHLDTLFQETAVDSLLFSHNGELVVIGEANSSRVSKMATQEQIFSIRGSAANSVFSPDDRHLAVPGDFEKGVRIIDLTSGQESRAFFGHTSSGFALAYSPDGKLFAAGSKDGSVRVWDATTQEQVRLYRNPWSVEALAFSPDSRKLVAGNAGNTLQPGECTVWDLASAQELTILKGQANEVWSQVWTVAFSPSSKLLAATGDDGRVVIWNVNHRKSVLTLEASIRSETSRRNTIYGAAFSPDGQIIASPSYDTQSRGCFAVRLWSAETGKPIRDLLGHTNVVLTLAFSPDGRRLASSSYGSKIKVWDVRTGLEVITLTKQGPFTTVVFSPDGARLAAATVGGTIFVWDARDGREILILKHEGRVCCIAFSPDGILVASSGSKGVKLWDAASGRELKVLNGLDGEVRCVAFSPDGLRLATTTAPTGMSLASDRSVKESIKIWDVATGLEILTLDGGSNGVAFSSDNSFLASGSRDGSVRVWDGRELRDEESAKVVVLP